MATTEKGGLVWGGQEEGTKLTSRENTSFGNAHEETGCHQATKVFY